MHAGPSQPATVLDAASRVDQENLARIYRKVMARQELTRAERRILKSHEKDKEERLRRQFYASIPQKHWREMSGRQSKVINEQAQRYGIPFGGPTVNLPDVVRSLHDFLAANAQKLAMEDDPLMQGSGSPALERYREERALMARMDREERERSLLRRDEVREGLGRIASILRAAGDTLQRHHGAGALEILNEALDDAVREMKRCSGDTDDPPGDPDGE